MVDDLLNVGLTDQDIPRIEEAFRRWGPHATRWPRCADILMHMPKRSEIPREALPEPQISADEARRNVADIKSMLKAKVGGER